MTHVWIVLPLGSGGHTGPGRGRLLTCLRPSRSISSAFVSRGQGPRTRPRRATSSATPRRFGSWEPPTGPLVRVWLAPSPTKWGGGVRGSASSRPSGGPSDHRTPVSWGETRWCLQRCTAWLWVCWEVAAVIPPRPQHGRPDPHIPKQWEGSVGGRGRGRRFGGCAGPLHAYVAGPPVVVRDAVGDGVLDAAQNPVGLQHSLSGF